jgi:hypothetical protein
LDQRNLKKQDDGENYIIRSFIFCTLLYTVRVIKSRRLRWTGHVAQMEKLEMHIKF